MRIKLILFLLITCVSSGNAQDAWTHLTEINGEDIGYVSDILISMHNEVWVSSLGSDHLFHYYDGAWFNESENIGFTIIYDIAEAPNGDMWFCSGNELFSYDGTFWYIHEEAPYPINDFDVDNSNNVWCSTTNGVLQYNGTSWILHSTQDGLVFNGTTHIVVDPDGMPWIRYGEPLTENQLHGGVSYYNGEIWETFTIDDGLLSNIVDDIAFDDNGSVYASHLPMYGGSHSGISRYSNGSWELLSSMSGKLLYDSEDNLWVTNYVYNEIYSYDGFQWKENTPNISISLTGINAGDKNGNIWFGTNNGIVTFDGTITMVHDDFDEPQSFPLIQTYPNPFNPATTFTYAIADPGHVELSVYSITGQKVATLVDDVQAASTYSVLFNGFSLGSGMFFYRFQSPGFTTTGKMLLVK